MVLHTSDVIAIHLHKNPIIEQSVLLISSLDLYPAIETTHLLDFGNDKIAFTKMLSHMQFIFFHFAPLNTTRQVYRCEI